VLWLRYDEYLDNRTSTISGGSSLPPLTWIIVHNSSFPYFGAFASASLVSASLLPRLTSPIGSKCCPDNSLMKPPNAEWVHYIHKLPNISSFSGYEDLRGFEKGNSGGIFERKESVALEGLANIIE
jgi:hypothetical protein